MMKYGDEDIISSLNNYKKYVYGDIHDTLYIKEIPYSFKRCSFFNKKLNVMIPVRFIDMPNEIKKIKYSRIINENVIKTNNNFTIDIVFELVDKYEEYLDLETEMENQLKLLKEVQPLYCIYENSIDIINNKKVCWYDFRSSAIDCQLYNLFFIMEIDNKLLIGKFICNIIKAEVWKKVFLEIISTINESENIKE